MSKAAKNRKKNARKSKAPAENGAPRESAGDATDAGMPAPESADAGVETPAAPPASEQEPAPIRDAAGKRQRNKKKGGRKAEVSAADAGDVGVDADAEPSPEDDREAPVDSADTADGVPAPRAMDDDSDDAAEISTESVVEAILFATDSPLSAKKIAQILGVGNAGDVKKHIDRLNQSYAKTGRSFRIEEIAKGFQMLTTPAYNNWLKQVLRIREETKLSRAAMETLAIIAYKQPILRADIEAIRGVAAGEMINRLREMELVKIVGRAEEIGRPILYGTTKKFLEVFGLASLEDLPKSDEFAPPVSPAEREATGDAPAVDADEAAGSMDTDALAPAGDDAAPQDADAAVDDAERDGDVVETIAADADAAPRG